MRNSQENLMMVSGNGKKLFHTLDQRSQSSGIQFEEPMYARPAGVPTIRTGLGTPSGRFLDKFASTTKSGGFGLKT